MPEFSARLPSGEGFGGNLKHFDDVTANIQDSLVHRDDNYVRLHAKISLISFLN